MRQKKNESTKEEKQERERKKIKNVENSVLCDATEFIDGLGFVPRGAVQ